MTASACFTHAAASELLGVVHRDHFHVWRLCIRHAEERDPVGLLLQRAELGIQAGLGHGPGSRSATADQTAANGSGRVR